MMYALKNTRTYRIQSKHRTLRGMMMAERKHQRRTKSYGDTIPGKLINGTWVRLDPYGQEWQDYFNMWDELGPVFKKEVSVFA